MEISSEVRVSSVLMVWPARVHSAVAKEAGYTLCVGRKTVNGDKKMPGSAGPSSRVPRGDQFRNSARVLALDLKAPPSDVVRVLELLSITPRDLTQ